MVINEWFALISGIIFGLCAVLPFVVLMLRPFPLVPGQPPYSDDDDTPRLPSSTKRQSPRVVVFDENGVPVLKMD